MFAIYYTVLIYGNICVCNIIPVYTRALSQNTSVRENKLISPTLSRKYAVVVRFVAGECKSHLPKVMYRK